MGEKSKWEREIYVVWHYGLHPRDKVLRSYIFIIFSVCYIVLLAILFIG